MPMLGDYLGHLLAEITAARMQADLETARIAELYAAHPLLRRMAVPRFRTPNITVDVPVSVTRMEEAAAGQPRRGGLSASALQTAVESATDAILRASFPKLTARVRAAVRAAAVEAVAQRGRPSDMALSGRGVGELAGSAAAAALEELASRNNIDPDAAERLRTELTAAAASTIAKAIVPPPRLHVAVTTGQLREAGPPEMLARLKLTISEEAMEWSVSESEGTTTTRLVPE